MMRRIQVNDDTTTNQHSDWVDTFVPIEHEHVWMGHTAYNRSHWFGRTSIACGGIGTVPTIFEQRNRLGEARAQKLAGEFHKLEKNSEPRFTFRELDAFTKTVIDDPESLLADGADE